MMIGRVVVLIILLPLFQVTVELLISMLDLTQLGK
jgi:hypothetical protein